MQDTTAAGETERIRRTDTRCCPEVVSVNTHDDRDRDHRPQANFQCVDCGGELSHSYGETFLCRVCGQAYRVTMEGKI